MIGRFRNFFSKEKNRLQSAAAIRICMLTHSVYSRDTRVRRYAEYLAQDGYKTDVICLNSENGLPQSYSPMVSVYSLPMTRIRNEGLGLIKSWFAVFASMFFLLSKLELKHHYDLIHVHNVPDFLVFCALIPRLRGCPVILNIHDPVPELAQSKLGLSETNAVIRGLRFLERISVGFSTHVITATRTFERLLISRNVPSQKITVISNAADPRFFRYDECAEKAREKRSGFTLLYVGTVAARYGLDVCIRALPTLKDRIPGLRLRIVPKIVCEGKALDDCLELARKLGVRDLVQVDQPVPLERMPDLMRDADVGVYPADVDCHMDIALSLKIPEMAATGLPIIATRLSVLEEIFGEDAIAFVPPRDPTAFASKVLELYESPLLRQALIRKAAEKSAELAWENQYETYRKLVEHLIGVPHDPEVTSSLLDQKG
jgi:glycosyltransferase involved in cell wall biosynthesis